MGDGEHMSNAAFALMAAALGGDNSAVPPGAQLSVRQCAERLRLSAFVLRQHGNAETQPVADAIDTWLTRGGDLAKLLGVKVGRGKASELPHREAMRTQRDALVSGLAARCRAAGLPEADVPKLLALAFRSPHLQAIVREHKGLELPTSQKAISLILRT